MAKSKPTQPPKTKTVEPKKTEVKQAKGKQAVATESAAPRAPGVLSHIEIGHVAGDVWGVLVRDGSLTVAAIKKAVDAPGDVVMAAIGWLAREDKLEFSAQGRSVTISLR
jgi:hypothetical protein